MIDETLTPAVDPTMTPDKAVQDLQGANATGLTTSEYNAMTPSQKTQSKNPAGITRGVASEMDKSQTKSSAIAPDAEKYSTLERFAARTSMGIDLSSKSRERAKLAKSVSEKRSKGLQPTQDELDMLDYYRMEIDDLNQGISKLGTGIVSSGIAEGITSIVDSVKDVAARPEVVAGATAVGAAAGASSSSTLAAIPVIGPWIAGVGVVAGGGAGLGVGVLTAGALESRDRYFGETYDELSVAQTPDGRPLNLPEDTKNSIANGVAYLSAGLDVAGEAVLTRTVPVLKRLVGGRELAKAATTQAGRTLLKSVYSFSKAVGVAGSTEGAVEVVQNLVQQLGTNLGQSWDGKETSLSTAIDKLTDSMLKPDQREKFWKQQAETFGIGFVAGGSFTAVGRGYSAVHDAVTGRNKVPAQTPAKVVNENPVVSPSVDKTMNPIEGTNNVNNNENNPSDQPVSPPGTQAIVTDEQGIPQFLNPQEALNFAVTMQAIVKGAEGTKIEGAPVDAIALQKKMLQESGVNVIWATEESLTKWAKTEEQRVKVDQILFGKREDIAMGAKIAINLDDALEMARQDEAFIRDMSKEPTDLTFNEVLEGIKVGKERGQQFFEQQGIARATEAPTVEAQGQPLQLEMTEQPTTAGLGPSSTDEEILGVLGSKQEANAYLDRLSQEQDAIMQEAVNQGLQPDDDLDDPRFTAIQQMRDRVTALSEQLPEAEPTPVDGDTELTPFEEAEALLENYVTTPLTTDLIKQGIPRKTIETMEQEYLRVRQEIAAATKDAATREMQQVVNVLDEIDKVEEAIELGEQALNDPNIEVVEMFLANRSEMQIDPASLSDAQRSRYLDDEALRVRKVFKKKDGLGIDEVATLLNLPDGDAVLEVLSSVPDRAQAIKNVKALREREVDTRILEGVDVNNAAIVKGLENLQKLRMQEIKMIAENSFARVRAIIEGTIFARLNMDAVKAEAIKRIKLTRLSELKPDNYRRAALIAAKKAVKAATRGDMIESARQREIEIRAWEYHKQALIAVGRGNNMIKRMARRMRNESTKTTLKLGGGLDAFNELNTTFNIEPVKEVGKVKAFEKWVNRQVKDGISNPNITPEMFEGYDPRAQLKDLSFDQIETLFNKQSEIINDAKARQEFTLGQETLYMDQMREVFDLSQHPDFDEDRTDVGPEDAATLFEQTVDLVRDVDTFMKNVLYTTLKLANGDRNSPIFNVIYNAMKGIGDFDNGFGEKGQTQAFKNVQTRVMEKLKTYGEKRIANYGAEWVAVPEWADSIGLLDGKGEMRKSEILAMLGLYGSEIGRARLANFNIDPDTVLAVVEKHLTVQDVYFLQEGIHDTYDANKPAIKRRQEILNGEEVEFTEGLGYNVFGIEFRGGHYPLSYRQNLTIDDYTKQAQQELDQLMGDQPAPPLESSTLKGFTREGYKISRVENFNGLPSLNFAAVVSRGFGDVITDTTMHVPIHAIMRLFADKEIASNIVKVIGKKQFNALRANILSAGKNIFSERINLVTDIENALDGSVSQLGYTYAKNLVQLRPSTVITQLASIPYIMSEMSFKGKVRSAFSVAKLITRPWLIPAAIDNAALINPSILQYINNIDETNKGAIYDLLPENRSKNMIIRAGMSFSSTMSTIGFRWFLGNLDTAMKVAANNGIYNDFLAGNAKGGLTSKQLEAMTPEQRTNAARAHTSSKIDGSLTVGNQLDKSLFQKSPKTKLWSLFFNDVRNIYNLTLHKTIDGVWKDGKNATKAARRGDIKGFVKHGMGAGWTMVQLQFYGSLAATIMNVAQGRDDEGEELPATFTGKWEEQVLETAFDNFFTPWIVPKAVISAVPVARDIMFNQQMRENTDNRFITIIAPLHVAALNKLSAGLSALSNLIWEGDLSDKETKELVEGAGTIGPVPIGLINKHIIGDDGQPGWFDSISRDPGILISLPLLAYELMNRSLTTSNASAYNEAAAIKQTLDPNQMTEMNAITSNQAAAITEYEEYTIMFAESGGNKKAKAEGSKATGLFQFIPKTWKAMMDDYPELGLTEAGRTDSDQQWIAFRKLTQISAAKLIRNKIPVSVDSIYAMHHFGDKAALKILKKPDNAPLPPLVEERKANPWLNGDVTWVNDGRRAKTVGDFKSGLRDLLNRGEELYLESLD